MPLADLMPEGCVVEVMNDVAAIHDPEGNLIAILCGPRPNLELARLIIGMPGILKAIDAALEHGILMPVALGMSILDREVFQPQLLPAD